MCDCTSEKDPPSTVKSWANTATRRPLILPKPVTTPSPGKWCCVHAEISDIVGCQGAKLLKGAFVKQQGQTFPGGHLAACMLLGDALAAAALHGLLAHLAKCL